MKSYLSIFLSVLVAALFCACNNQPEPAKLEGISLNKRSIEIEVGQSYKLRVSFDPSEAEPEDPVINWESSKTNVATVSEDGVVKAKAEGSAVITASYKGFEATCKVEVVPEPDPVPVEAIEFNVSSLELQEGQKFRLTVTYIPAESERFAEELVWSSSDPSVATVDDGLVEALKPGVTLIQARCGEFITASCGLYVTEFTNEISLYPTSISFPADGGSRKVTVTSATAWSLSYDADWLTVTPTSGSGDAELTVTAQANTGTGPTKSAIINFQNTEKSASLTVTREGIPYPFTVGATTKVEFAPGNLQYQASTNTARFAPNQYDIIGAANEAVSSTYTGWIDLFEWGKGDNLSYYNATATGGASHKNFTDWGDNMPSAGNPWRTLSKGEWEYLYSKRPQASSLCGMAKVNNINGFIFLPDNFEKPSGISFSPGAASFSVNTYTVSQWSQLQDAGAVFLPSGGCRTYQSPTDPSPRVNMLNYGPRYWSSTSTEYDATAWYFGSNEDDGTNMFTTNRSYGNSVRLVKDIP